MAAGDDSTDFAEAEAVRETGPRPVDAKVFAEDGELGRFDRQDEGEGFAVGS